MKNKLFTVAGALLLLAIVGKFYAKPVWAQVRATFIQDVDQPARAPFQPIVLVTASVAGNNAVSYYFGPNPSATDPGQYYASYPTTIYADSLSVSPAFAGYTPTFDSFNVNISGHLITP